MAGFMTRIGRKAAEMASEYTRINGMTITQQRLELLLERAMMEGAKIGAETGMFLTKVEHPPNKKE